MFSPPPVRATKRRIDEIDGKIDCITKVISTLTGYDRTYFDNKLLGVKLKKQKLIAHSAVVQTQTMHRILADIDILIAENDLNLEIESIRNCNKFKTSEKSMLKREKSRKEDGHATKQDRNSKRETVKKVISAPCNNTTDANLQLHAQEYPKNSHSVTGNTTMQLSCQYESLQQVASYTNAESFNQNSKEITQTAKEIPLEKNKAQSTSITKKMSQDKKHQESSYKTNEAKSYALVNSVTPKQQYSMEHKLATSKSLNGNTTIKETSIVPSSPYSNTSHQNVINLFKTYKKIYSPEISTMNRTGLSQSSKDLATKTVGNSSDKNISTPRGSRKAEQNTVNRVSSQVHDFSNSLESHGSKSSSKRSKKSHKSNDSSRSSHKKSQSKDSSSKKYHTMPKKLQETSRVTERTAQTSDIINDIVSDESAVTYMTKLVELSCAQELGTTVQGEEHRKGINKNGAQSDVQEDIVNSLFKDIMASKRMKIENGCSSTSNKTTICLECGLVAEGHVCAYTIRELLEQC